MLTQKLTYGTRPPRHGWFTSLVLFGCVVASYTAYGIEADLSDVAEPVTEEHFAPEPVATITLAEAIALALEHNPYLETFSWDARIGDARILQAGLRPNPELSLEIEDIRIGDGPESRGSTVSLTGLPPVVSWERERDADDASVFGNAELSLSISQLVEVGGKRARRIAVAREDKALSQWDYETARANVITGVAQSFFAVLVAQEELQLEEELTTLAEDVTRVIAARVDAGEVSPLENNRAALARSSVKMAWDKAKRDLAAKRIRLAAYWGTETPHFDRAEGVLDEIDPIPSMDVLSDAIRQNPDLARWAAEIAQREAAVALERSNRTVDPTISFGIKSAGTSGEGGGSYGIDTEGSVSFSGSRSNPGRDRDTTIGVGVSIPLPLFNRNQGNLAEARHRLAKGAAELRAAESTAISQLAQTHEMAMAAYEAISWLNVEVLPKAKETFEKTQRGYQAGKFPYMDVLDAQRTLFDGRTQYLSALAEYHDALVAIERLTGKSFQAWNSTRTLREE